MISVPPDIKAAKDEADEVFVNPKINLASGLACISCPLVHLVFGRRSQSKSLVHVPESYYKK